MTLTLILTHESWASRENRKTSTEGEGLEPPSGCPRRISSAASYPNLAPATPRQHPFPRQNRAHDSNAGRPDPSRPDSTLTLILTRPDPAFWAYSGPKNG
jgi:hypothetical protein